MPTGPFDRQLSRRFSTTIIVAVGIIAAALGYLRLRPDLGKESPPRQRAQVVGPPPGERPFQHEFGPSLEMRFKSAFFDKEIVVLPGVFPPLEAEQRVLPLMKDNPKLFEGKSVLEIGGGSGINSVYAAKLGAKKVVATDISEAAIAAIRQNAEQQGVSDKVEARLVAAGDTSAYATMAIDEAFDTILSNPPYALDLDAAGNTPTTDTGDLGFSIVDGLERHLKPSGAVLLLYYDVFYHLAMVKYARFKGYDVRYNCADVMTPWGLETIFNAYLARLLKYRGVDPNAFRFDYKKDRFPEPKFEWKDEQPLFSDSGSRRYPGWMVIARPTTSRGT